MLNITKGEVRDKMFFITDEKTGNPVAVIKVADLLSRETDTTKAMVLREAENND